MISSPLISQLQITTEIDTISLLSLCVPFSLHSFQSNRLDPFLGELRMIVTESKTTTVYFFPSKEPTAPSTGRRRYYIYRSLPAFCLLMFF